MLKKKGKDWKKGKILNILSLNNWTKTLLRKIDSKLIIDSMNWIFLSHKEHNSREDSSGLSLKIFISFLLKPFADLD